MSENKFANQCRLCRKSEGNLLSIFDGQKVENLAKMIYDNLSLMVKENDMLPKMICESCKHIIEEFANFRQSCLLAEEYYRSSLGKKDSLFEPECCLNEDESFNQEPANNLTAVVKLEINDEPCKMEVTTEDDFDLAIGRDSFSTRNDNFPESVGHESSDISQSSSQQCSEKKSKLKEPHPDDFVLVKEETFLLKNNEERSSNVHVEFSNLQPTDKALVNDMCKKREVLPQMWDVFETKPESKEVLVTRRRYIISKAAFPCSLCTTCITIEHEAPIAEDRSPEVESAETEDSSELLVCEFCQKSFTKTVSLRRHLHTHFDYKALPCKICGRGFSRKEHLERHMLLHTGGRPYICNVCQKSFTRKEHLTRHQLIHGHRATSVGISGEGDQEVHGGNGTDHVRQERDGERAKPFTCKQCGAGFGRKEHLVRHINRVHDSPPKIPELKEHEEGKPYLCTLCPRSFTRKEHLLRHHRVHVRDFMFVNESRVPGTDITLSLINSSDKKK